MKKQLSATAIALLAVTVFVAQSPAKMKGELSAPQARATLEDICGMAEELTTAADQLASIATRQDESDRQLEQLNMLRDGINVVGRELASLQAAENTLPEWQQSTISEALPILRDLATMTDEAIANFNTNRVHLWTTDFPTQANKMYEDAKRFRNLVLGNLKLASVRAHEQKIEASLSSNQ